MVQHRLAFGQRLVVGDRDLRVADRAELREVGLRLVDDGLVLGVEVGPHVPSHRVALHRHAQRVAPVVEDPDLAAIGLRVPEDVPRDVHARDVLLDLVVAPADPVHPDDVRDRVARAAVVERVGQLGPDVLLEVGQVGVVERLEQLAGDQVDHVRAAQAHDQVERHRPGRELRDRLVGRVVGRDLDLRVELLLELLDRRRVDVVGVVVDPQRAGLGLDAVRDRLVVVGDRPRHRVVGAWEREPRGAERLGDDELRRGLGDLARGIGGADRRRRVLTAREGPGGAETSRGDGRPAQQLAPAHARFLGMHVRPSPPPIGELRPVGDRPPGG